VRGRDATGRRERPPGKSEEGQKRKGGEGYEKRDESPFRLADQRNESIGRQKQTGPMTLSKSGGSRGKL